MDPALILGAFGVGIVVGLTGMGGGALMTPMLVLLFGVNPLTAVSSDLVASAVMKPFGGFVHLRHRTVNLRLVGLLCLGSVPAAFCGVILLEAMGDDDAVQTALSYGLGGALLLTALLLGVRAYLRFRTRGRADATGSVPAQAAAQVTLRPVPTVLLGAAGGLLVGVTSVGSGSLIIIGLMALYPALKTGQLVGTDLVQAVPLVASAAISHALFGDVDLVITLPLLIGSIPGTVVGAMLSSRLPSGIIRGALTVVLLASGLKLLGAPDLAIVAVVVVALVAAPILWARMRRRASQPEG
jgi:uncharacterized protein